MGLAAQTEIENSGAQAATPTGLELVIAKAINPLQVFTASGLDPILQRIESETRSIVLDISTKKGREQIASLAHKVAKSKTALDAAGKELVAGWKEQAKKVDLERARAWDRLDALQKEVRQPLTDWEDAEKTRVTNHEENLARMESAARAISADWQTMPLQDMQDRLQAITEFNPDWQEFAVKAKQATELAIATITAAIEKRQKHDAEQAELARHRKEEEIRKQREHEERLKAEAAEKARMAAEEKAKLEAEAAAKRVKAEQERAEKERLRITREMEAAEARALKAEQARVAAEEKAAKEKELAEQRAAQAERDRIAAEAKAKDDARRIAENAALDKKAAEEAAALRERQRIEAEKKAETAATAKREADKAHRAKIDREIYQTLIALIYTHHPKGADSYQIADLLLACLTAGEVPHISNRY